MNIVADAYHVLLFAFVDIKLAELQMVLSCTQHYDVVWKRAKWKWHIVVAGDTISA